MALFWFGSFALMQHGTIAFHKTFPNLSAYKNFSDHPNYKLLGPVYSYFYMARPFFWAYITMRMTRFLYHMIKRHWAGNDDPHYFWFFNGPARHMRPGDEVGLAHRAYLVSRLGPGSYDPCVIASRARPRILSTRVDVQACGLAPQYRPSRYPGILERRD